MCTWSNIKWPCSIRLSRGTANSLNTLPIRWRKGPYNIFFHPANFKLLESPTVAGEFPLGTKLVGNNADFGFEFAVPFELDDISGM